MSVRDVLLSPPVAGLVFMGLAFGLYRLSGALAAKGEEHPGKHQPYACGEDLLPPETQLVYHAFFHLALIFALLHLATLVISTLPPDREAHILALVYLSCIIVSVLVLVQEDDW
jgi:NADH:ubiquinone oxidoreductase subunit 3 (subunit A)